MQHTGYIYLSGWRINNVHLLLLHLAMVSLTLLFLIMLAGSIVSSASTVFYTNLRVQASSIVIPKEMTESVKQSVHHNAVITG